MSGYADRFADAFADVQGAKIKRLEAQVATGKQLLREEMQRSTERGEEVLKLREALQRAIDFVKHAEVSSGVCCCGDSMAGHGNPMETGHSPRDMWDYAVEGFVKETQKVLDGGGPARYPGRY